MGYQSASPHVLVIFEFISNDSTTLGKVQGFTRRILGSEPQNARVQEKHLVGSEPSGSTGSWWGPMWLQPPFPLQVGTLYFHLM